MQSSLDVTTYPIDLSEYGTTPGGLSLYRVVQADTRISKLLYEGKLHEFGRYEDQPLANGKWIVEKWLPAEKITGMTREQWENFFASQAFGAPKEEYPTDGDYELVVILEKVNVAGIRALIEQLEFRLRNVSLEDRKREVISEKIQAEVVTREKKKAILSEAIGRDAPAPEVNRVYPRAIVDRIERRTKESDVN